MKRQMNLANSRRISVLLHLGFLLLFLTIVSSFGFRPELMRLSKLFVEESVEDESIEESVEDESVKDLK
jgi:hypothetical protein